MKRTEEIITNVLQTNVATGIEAAVMTAVFQFTEQVFQEGGNVFVERFKSRFGRFAYDKFLVMIGERRN